MADHECIRSRKASFTPVEKERIKHCLQLYHEQGFDLVNSMFELSKANIANVPENTLRAWNKEWKIPFRPRLRQPRFDTAKIRPLFEELYAQPDKYTLDDIVFIIFHRLGVPATKSSYLKWRDKWKLPDRYQRRSRGSQSQSGRQLPANSALGPSSDQPNLMLHAAQGSQDSSASGVPTVSDDMEYSDEGSEVVSIASSIEQGVDDPFQVLQPSAYASPTDRDWVNVGIVDNVLIHADIANDGPRDIFGSGKTWTQSYDTLNDLDLVSSSYNHTVIDLTTAADFENTESHQIITLEGNSVHQESRDDAKMDFQISSCATNEHLFGLVPINTHELRMIDCVQQYVTWIRRDIFLRRDEFTPDSQPTDLALSVRNPPEWEFYSAGFNAAQDTASKKTPRQQAAQREWRIAKKSATSAFHQPTERLLPCVLLFYTNAFIKGGAGLHKQNFQVLYELACQILQPTNPVTHLLNLLSNSDMSSVGTEVNVMAFLVSIMTQDPSADFNATYESYELYITALQKSGNLLAALAQCDDLITFSQNHAPAGDPAPLLRAQRRKGRILSAQRRPAEARALFQLILSSWEWLGKPCVFSKEYIVFEDLARLCVDEGDIAGAEAYYAQAVSFSNLSYRPGSSNTLRIMELTELMKEVEIEEEEGWVN